MTRCTVYGLGPEAAVYLSGGDRNYSLQSVSGDIRIYRR